MEKQVKDYNYFINAPHAQKVLEKAQSDLAVFRKYLPIALIATLIFFLFFSRGFSNNFFGFIVILAMVAIWAIGILILIKNKKCYSIYWGNKSISPLVLLLKAIAFTYMVFLAPVILLCIGKKECENTIANATDYLTYN